MTLLLQTSPKTVAAAASALREGLPVALPTETVYGLAAHALLADGVAAVFAAKGRPADDPLIVHVSPSLLGASPAEALDRLGLTRVPDHLHDVVNRLAAAFWPGPLTLLLPRGPAIADTITAGHATVAVRVPRHPTFLAVLDAVGAPLVAPSANRFGHISPTTAQAVRAELEGRIPLILDGGPCEVGLESTILRLDPPAILRPGALSAADLAHVLGAVPPLATDAPSVAPGLLDRHYSPRTPLLLDATPPHDTHRIGLLAWTAPESSDPRVVAIELLTADLPEAARRLYGAMRSLDESGCEVILASTPPGEGGLHAALVDRLRRAAGLGRA